jgi:hypothetical protein
LWNVEGMRVPAAEIGGHAKVVDDHVAEEGVQHVDLPLVQGLLPSLGVEDFVRHFLRVG